MDMGVAFRLGHFNPPETTSDFYRMGLCGPQEWLGRFEETKNALLFLEIYCIANF
jgi:hypothetical protein